MKRRTVYQVIIEVKSAPVGVNWSMIRTAKKSIHRQKYFQSPVSKISVAESLEKQFARAS